MDNTRKKRVLLLAPDFFGYYKEIKKGLTAQGWDVDVILENFVNQSYLYRFFYVKNDKLKKRYTRKYYINKFAKMDDGYDCIFVIRGEALSTELLRILKNNNPEAVFIMYQWDSARNNKNALLIENEFDRIYTFDIEDAKDYGWIYRPLFFLENKELIKTNKDIDFAFIGTLYYKRALLFKRICDYCRNNNLSLFHYLYCPKLVYYIHKYIMHDSRYSIVKRDEVEFIPLKNEFLIEQYKKTKILVDYTADDQTGLTMRTIESIGYDCKIITNNKKIMETNLYEYGNVFVYDIEDFDIPKEFIDKEYSPLPEDLYNYYSLTGWINSIFEDI